MTADVNACDLRTREGFDFAWCETHDETFPLGATCSVRLVELGTKAISAQADAMVGFRWKHLPEGAYYEIQAATLASARRTRAECEAMRRIVERAAAHGSGSGGEK